MEYGLEGLVSQAQGLSLRQPNFHLRIGSLAQI